MTTEVEHQPKEIKIVTTDNKSFVISKEIVAESTTLLELCQFMDDSNAESEFPVTVESDVISMLLEWYSHSIDDSEWIVPFLKSIDTSKMMKIILGLHYLGNKCLFFRLMSYKMALLMRSKTPEEIAETFGCPAFDSEKRLCRLCENPLTAEENEFCNEDREMIAMEAKWTEESKGDYYLPPDMKELHKNHPEYFSLF